MRMVRDQLASLLSFSVIRNSGLLLPVARRKQSMPGSRNDSLGGLYLNHH